MSLDHVITQVSEEREGPVAHGARVRLYAVMASYVGVADRPLVESLTTKFTFVRATSVLRVLRSLVHPCRCLLAEPLSTERACKPSLPGMGDQVEIQHGRSLEPLRTVGTRVRTLVRMAHHVNFKTLQRRVGLRTARTPVCFDLLVNVADVLRLAAPSPEELPTLLALVPALVGVRVQMGSEVARRREAPAALDAEVRSLVRVDAPVFGQIVLARELAAAVGALEAGMSVQSHVDLEGAEHFTTDRAQLGRPLQVSVFRPINHLADYHASRQLRLLVLLVDITTRPVFNHVWNTLRGFAVGVQSPDAVTVTG